MKQKQIEKNKETFLPFNPKNLFFTLLFLLILISQPIFADNNPNTNSNNSDVKNVSESSKSNIFILSGMKGNLSYYNKMLSLAERYEIDQESGQAVFHIYTYHLKQFEDELNKHKIAIKRIMAGEVEEFQNEVSKIFPKLLYKETNNYVSKGTAQEVVSSNMPEPLHAIAYTTCSSFPEGFEGVVWYPYGNWYHFQDSQGQGGGSYFWNDRYCSAHSGSYSVDAILGGSTGGGLSCGSNYPDNLTCDSNASWLEYAYWITCTYGASAANLDFWYQLNSEATYDFMKVFISTDNIYWYGYYLSGLLGSSWYDLNLDLRNWYILGDLTAYSGGFALKFEFCSNASFNYPFGARLDDITISYTPSQLSYIQITSGPPQVNENSNAQYTCTAYYSDGTTADVTSSASWSINTPYASISGGYLTTYEVPSDQYCQIIVNYGGKTALANITIKNVAATLSYIQITSGPPQVNENSNAQYTCTAYYSDGTTADITSSASWSINTPYASISGGYLTTYEVPSDQYCQITVNYGGKTALANITIKNVSGGCPTITLSPSFLPNGIVGTYYNQTITASGGTGSYTFEVGWK